MHTTITIIPFEIILQYHVATSYIKLVWYEQIMPRVKTLFLHVNMFAIILKILNEINAFL